MDTRLFIVIMILIISIFLSYAMNIINMIRINRLEKLFDDKIKESENGLERHETILEELDERIYYLNKEIKK